MVQFCITVEKCIFARTMKCTYNLGKVKYIIALKKLAAAGIFYYQYKRHNLYFGLNCSFDPESVCTFDPEAGSIFYRLVFCTSDHWVEGIFFIRAMKEGIFVQRSKERMFVK